MSQIAIAIKIITWHRRAITAVEMEAVRIDAERCGDIVPMVVDFLHIEHGLDILARLPCQDGSCTDVVALIAVLDETQCRLLVDGALL